MLNVSGGAELSHQSAHGGRMGLKRAGGLRHDVALFLHAEDQLGALSLRELGAVAGAPLSPRARIRTTWVRSCAAALQFPDGRTPVSRCTASPRSTAARRPARTPLQARLRRDRCPPPPQRAARFSTRARRRDAPGAPLGWCGAMWPWTAALHWRTSGYRPAHLP